MAKWAKKRGIMHRYDSTAHIYDNRYSEEQDAKFKAALKHVNIGKSDTILDAGCGTGLFLECVGGRAGFVVGIDISRRTLREARERSRRFLNVHLILGDIDNVPLTVGLFSKMFAFTVLQNSPDPLCTLEEIKRVAMHNSTVIITGLKRIFSLDFFEQMLFRAGLEITAMEVENLQCFVAVCRIVH